MIGFASGDVPQVPANILLVKNVDLIGFYWGGYLKFRPDLLSDSLAELLGWLADHTSIAHVFYLCSFLPLVGLLTVFLPNLDPPKPAR